MAIKTDILTDDTGAKSINVIDLIGASIETMVLFDIVGGVPTIVKSIGVASITDLGIGQFRINFITPMPSKNYLALICPETIAGNSTNSVQFQTRVKTVNGFEITNLNTTNAFQDSVSYSAITLGSV